jgi:hypothetical protein
VWAFEYKRTVLNPITAIEIKVLVGFGSLGQMNVPANNAVAIMDFSELHHVRLKLVHMVLGSFA